MSESYYNSPNSDVQASEAMKNGRRTATTVYGWLLMVFGGIGLIIAAFGIFAIANMGVEFGGLSKNTLFIDSILSAISKVGLVSVAIGLLSRGAWVSKAVIFGFICSLVDSVFKALTVIPAQVEMAPSEAVAMGNYFGFYLVAALSLAVYISLYFYLKSENSNIEFGIKR